MSSEKRNIEGKSNHFSHVEMPRQLLQSILLTILVLFTIFAQSFVTNAQQNSDRMLAQAEATIYLPIVTNQPDPVSWYRISSRGFRISALAFHNGLLFFGDRRSPQEDHGGVYKGNPVGNGCTNLQTFEITSPDISVLDIDFFGDKYGIIGTFKEKVYYTHNNGDDWQQTSTAMNEDVYAVTHEMERVFAGANSRLYESSDFGRTWTPWYGGPAEINRLRPHNGTIWIGSENGVWSFQLSNNQFQEHNQGLPNSEISVWDFAFGQNNEIYISTKDGVYRQMETDTWMPFGLQSNDVRSLELWGSYLYAGLSNGGVWRVSLLGSGEWEEFSQGDSLLVVTTVRDLLLDETYCNGLWAATDRGVWILK